MTPARHAVPLAFVLAILLALPSLNAPLLQDDVIHRGMLLDKAKGVQWSPLELYDFVGGPTRRASLMRDRGLLPWFTDDELTLRFFRPLSSAALAFDARLFGERTWLSRLHSLSWFLAILGLAAALHRRFLPPATAGVATLIYALAAGHALPVSFIAARHALVCTAFSLLAFWCHVRGRDDGWRPGRWLAPAAVAVGLFGGEMALGAVALIGAWELFGRRDRLPARLLAVIPFAVLAVVYLGGYVAMDYGARGSGALYRAERRPRECGDSRAAFPDLGRRARSGDARGCVWPGSSGGPDGRCALGRHDDRGVSVALPVRPAVLRNGGGHGVALDADCRRRGGPAWGARARRRPRADAGAGAIERGRGGGARRRRRGGTRAWGAHTRWRLHGSGARGVRARALRHRARDAHDHRLRARAARTRATRGGGPYGPVPRGDGARRGRRSDDCHLCPRDPRAA